VMFFFVLFSFHKPFGEKKKGEKNIDHLDFLFWRKKKRIKEESVVSLRSGEFLVNPQTESVFRFFEIFQ